MHFGVHTFAFSTSSLKAISRKYIIKQLQEMQPDELIANQK